MLLSWKTTRILEWHDACFDLARMLRVTVFLRFFRVCGSSLLVPAALAVLAAVVALVQL